VFNIGDLVIINNDSNQFIYKIKEIRDKVCLVGNSYRVIKYADINDIRHASIEEIDKEKNDIQKVYDKIIQNNSNRHKRAIFGRVLHIDGDKEYLDSCLSLYKELGIFSEGIYLSEKEVYKEIEKIMLLITPDIVVITGHDAFVGSDKTKVNNYENSGYFVKTIRAIRKHFGIDEVIIIAGACESHFEALIAAGANFASSPKRINTHTYDPAVVAIKAATTSINKTIDFENILKYIENGKDALGGIETKGKMRLLL
jgi:spore coat assembly protein